MWQYACTVGAMVGLPLFLYKYSMLESDEDDQMTDDNIDDLDRKMPKLSFMKIQKKGLLTRMLVTGCTYSGILGLYYYYYPQMTDNMPKDKKERNGGIRMLSSMLIFNWRWKMIEMMFSGKEFFIKNNITKSWQVILSSIILPSRIDFNKNNDLNTRQNALLHLLEFLGYGAIITVMNKKILLNKNIDVPKLPLIIQVILMSILTLAVPMMYNTLSIITGLIFGNNVNIRYCYSFPFLSLNLKDFWKRWSIHVGEPLRNYVYLPLGGWKYPIFGSSMVFLINAIDHIWLAEMIVGSSNATRIGYLKFFTVTTGGTAIDMLLHSYFIKKKKKDSKTMIINSLRYGLMWITVIAQTMWSWNELSAQRMEPYSIQNKKIK